MSEPDSKQIIRRWNREIEAEIRRDAALNARNGRWRAVVWAALWLFWLLLLVALVAHGKALG